MISFRNFVKSMGQSLWAVPNQKVLTNQKAVFHLPLTKCSSQRGKSYRGDCTNTNRKCNVWHGLFSLTTICCYNLSLYFLLVDLFLSLFDRQQIALFTFIWLWVSIIACSWFNLVPKFRELLHNIEYITNLFSGV